jgi:hypothetical protein
MSERIEFKASISIDDAGMVTGLAWPFGTPDRVGDESCLERLRAQKAPLPTGGMSSPKGLLLFSLVDDLARVSNQRGR